MTVEIGDDVRINVGKLAGLRGEVISRHSGGRLGVSIDSAAPKIYSERSLTLVRAAAHIRRGDYVVRKAEPNGPIGVVQSRGAMRLAVEWNGLPALGIDAREVQKITKREGPIVRDPEPPAEAGDHRTGAYRAARKFGQCRWCPVRTDHDNLAAHEAAHVRTATGGPTVAAHLMQHLPECARARSGVTTCAPGCPVSTEAKARSDAAHAARAEARVYPLGRPESGDDPRFTVGLWLGVVKTIEGAGYPRLSGADATRVRDMLFRFIYDKGE